MSSSPGSPGPGDPEFLEQLRRMLGQMGLNIEGSDLSRLLSTFGTQFGGGGFGLGFTPADQDPDAAWRTTMTAAEHQLPEHGPDPKPQPETLRLIADAGRLADSWLEEHTAFASVGLEATGWTRAQWLRETGPAWRRMVEPIITGSANALGEGMRQPEPELAGLQEMFAPMLRTSASLMYREQLKRNLAKLASMLLTGSELGIQLLPKAQVVLLPTTVSSFTDGLDVPEGEVLLYLASRETARQRLFAAVGWLGPQLSALVEHYAREITIDLDFIGRQINVDNPEELSIEAIAEVGRTVTGSFFEPASTDTQKEILARLETLLALVEGWVDEVTATATANWLTSATQLGELVRRRRAAGDPAQTVFASLVGLELRPRRIRDAANLWAALTQARGAEGRDAVWAHPDLIPTSDDLDDPLRFVSGEAVESGFDDLDAELEKLLREESGDDPTS